MKVSHATIAGLVVGMVVGVCKVVRDLASIDRAARARHRITTELSRPEESCILEVEISNITRSWIVLELEDFGPGYLIATGEEEYVYILGETFVDDTVSDLFPTSRMIACVDSRSQAVRRVEFAGADVPVEGVVYASRLPFDPSVGFRVLSKSEMDEIGDAIDDT